MNSSNVPFCKDDFWNWNVTWYTDDPDFTMCFHSTVPVYLPALFYWVVAPIYTWKKKILVAPTSNRKWARITVSRIVGVAALFVLELAWLVVKMVSFQTDPASLADVVAPGVASLTYALILLILARGKLKGSQRSSGINFVFWTLSAIGAIGSLTSSIKFPNKRSPSLNNLIVIKSALVAAMFALEFFPNPIEEVSAYQNIDCKLPLFYA